MSEARFITPDITAALDRWAGVAKDGGPEHQAASSALDDILEGLCEDREAWGQALIEKHQVERALLACADQLDRHAIDLPTVDYKEIEGMVADIRKEHTAMKASAARTREWLEREGFALAAAAMRGAEGDTPEGPSGGAASQQEGRP